MLGLLTCGTIKKIEQSVVLSLQLGTADEQTDVTSVYGVSCPTLGSLIYFLASHLIDTKRHSLSFSLLF